MSRLLVNISYASIEAYEFDGIKDADDERKYTYHQICSIQRNTRPSSPLINDSDLPILEEISNTSKSKKSNVAAEDPELDIIYDELAQTMSDSYGNGWKNNLILAVLWSPEYTEAQKSAFKKLLTRNGIENFDFYEPHALSDYLLQTSGKFNSSCRYAINLWSNDLDVHIKLYSFSEDGLYKFIGKEVAKNAAEDPRISALTQKMMKKVGQNVENAGIDEAIIRSVAERFINSRRATANEIVRLSSGYSTTILLTDEYKDCPANGSDILNNSLASLLRKNHIEEKECQVVLSPNFIEKQNLQDVITRMFTYVCNESGEQKDYVFQFAFKQMEYTIRTSENLHQRTAFCGDGYVIDKPVLITWTCPKCGYTYECAEVPNECPNCHINDMPKITGSLTIDAVIHETKKGCFINRKITRYLEINITAENGGIDAKLLLIVGKKPIGVYDRNIVEGRWTREFSEGIKKNLSIAVTQNDYPDLAQAGTTFIDIKPHYSYQDVNAFVVKTKKI